MREWVVSKPNKENARRICERYNLPPVVAALLDIRNITSENDIESFLSDDALIDDPFEIRDMDKAVKRVKLAVENGEKICVYGDYDADGVTATALMYSYLETIGADVMYYIPDREAEGYGLHNSAVEYMSSQGVGLILTVDNGVAAVDEIAYASSLGMDTVVTDHHVVTGELPAACAVVDLHRPDCGSRFKEISGVGVAFKLVCAIEGEYADIGMLLDNYSDLVALGTIGDLVSLTDENRVFVKRGLEIINRGDRVGLRVLVSSSGIGDKAVSAGDVSFRLVPRINAVGRLGHSKDSVALLLTEDEEHAFEIAEKLTEDNEQRRKLESQILEDINSLIARNPALVQDRVIVIDGEGWKKGVVGIVSSRIKDIYGKPCLIISREGEVSNGSGRSIEGFDLWQAINSCSDILGHFGGHKMACGFGLKTSDIPLFRQRINAYAATLGELPTLKLKIDFKLNPSAVDVELIDQLSMLSPFGVGNPSPVFQLGGLTIHSITPVSGDTHLRLSFMTSGNYLRAMFFRRSTKTFPYKVGDKVDIAVSLSTNEFRGNREPAITICDIRFCDADNASYIKSNHIFENFCRGEKLKKDELLSIFPSREDFALVYRYLRNHDNLSNLHLDVLTHNLGGTISYGKLRVILEAMNDLNLIAIYEDMKRCGVKMREVSSKVSLEDASIIKSLKEVYRSE